MNLSGKVVIKGLEVPMCNRNADEVEIHYNLNFKVSEIKESLDLIDVLPEKLNMIADVCQRIREDNQKAEEENALKRQSIINDIKEDNLKK